jgi:hypothetical protein
MTVACTCTTNFSAKNNIQLLRVGQRTVCPNLYVLPQGAESVHNDFYSAMKSGDWGFVLVKGENGAGKSAYIKNIEALANGIDYAISHIEVNEKLVKQYGPNGYFTRAMFHQIRMPDGEILLYKISSNDSFRKKLHSIIEHHRADFDFYSPALTQALSLLTDDKASSELKKHANSWMNGDPRLVWELREMEITDKTMKSILNVPTDKMLYLIKDMLGYLDLKGLLVSVDEIEKAGDLPRLKGRETLSTIRDLINILTSEESLPTKRGAMKGLFICYAVSTFFLGWSGALPDEDVDFKALAERYGKPNISIQEVPRLATMLLDSGATIPVDFGSLTDLEDIATPIIEHYNKAYSDHLDITAKDLASESYSRTGRFLARPNVMAMTKILDEKRKTE